VSGVVFSAILLNSQTLQCAIQFTSQNMPGTSTAQGNYVYVTAGAIQSNSLSVYYTVPPVISSGLMLSKTRIYLAGSNFIQGAFCEYRTGIVTSITLKGTTGSALNCDVRGITSSTISFDVRVNSFGQVSNWNTVPVPPSIT